MNGQNISFTIRPAPHWEGIKNQNHPVSDQSGPFSLEGQLKVFLGVPLQQHAWGALGWGGGGVRVFSSRRRLGSAYFNFHILR